MVPSRLPEAKDEGNPTLIVDFRADNSNIFVEAFGHDHSDIDVALNKFLQANLSAIDAMDAKDFAPVKHEITHLYKNNGTRNNMSNMYCMISDFMTTEQGWQLQSLTGMNNIRDMGTLTFQKLPVSRPMLSTLVIDFRCDGSNMFVEATGQNYKGIHDALKTFFEDKLGATNARDAKDVDFAPVKHKITHLVKFIGTRNNMSNMYCMISDFMTTEQGWQLQSLTGVNNELDMGTLTFQLSQGDTE
eukprot:TRINITY_DN11422_c0_g2_i5.p1 TRINITY_DN11422_c0_g2~~TRINITY_DN11422_c0_g2_i5.p1  ORF type:complete len:274 (-),score=43.01 TRINITY_DN11422_c0_g2_i5:97-831(-)